MGSPNQCPLCSKRVSVQYLRRHMWTNHYEQMDYIIENKKIVISQNFYIDTDRAIELLYKNSGKRK